MSKAWQNVMVIAAGLLFAVLYYVWFGSRIDKEREYKQTPIGMAEVQGDIDIRKMKVQLEMEKERRRQMQADQRSGRQPQSVSQASAPVASPVRSDPVCQNVDGETGFLNPVRPSSGGCLASNTEYLWVRFDSPPREVSGAIQLSLVEEMPRNSSTDDRRIRMRESCAEDFVRCAREWAGETLLIKRAPGQQLIIRL